jgi:hypothetical protein
MGESVSVVSGSWSVARGQWLVSVTSVNGQGAVGKRSRFPAAPTLKLPADTDHCSRTPVLHCSALRVPLRPLRDALPLRLALPSDLRVIR